MFKGIKKLIRKAQKHNKEYKEFKVWLSDKQASQKTHMKSHMKSQTSHESKEDKAIAKQIKDEINKHKPLSQEQLINVFNRLWHKANQTTLSRKEIKQIYYEAKYWSLHISSAPLPPMEQSSRNIFESALILNFCVKAPAKEDEQKLHHKADDNPDTLSQHFLESGLKTAIHMVWDDIGSSIDYMLSKQIITSQQSPQELGLKPSDYASIQTISISTTLNISEGFREMRMAAIRHHGNAVVNLKVSDNSGNTFTSKEIYGDLINIKNKPLFNTPVFKSDYLHNLDLFHKLIKEEEKKANEKYI